MKGKKGGEGRSKDRKKAQVTPNKQENPCLLKVACYPLHVCSATSTALW
jgi:hypothetical protein